MASVICHICLRTDIIAVSIDAELTYFIDEVCDYNITENPRYKYCSICTHLVKKFYNFKQRCLKACKILKSLKRRSKSLPTNLHEQIPSSIGLCSSIARYELLEHQYDTDSDLLETKPDLNSIPNITLNNAEVHSKQNLETADPMLPDPIAVKDEPILEVLDSDIDTMVVADGENIYKITLSDDNLTLRSNFEEDSKIITLQSIKEELNTDDDGTTEDGSQDNAKQTKIENFLGSSNKKIQNFEDNSVEVYDMVIKDTMVNNDPLVDDDSLNSMDGIENDIGDCDTESLSMDEQSGESSLRDHDSDSLSDIIKEANIKKIQINEKEELELVETLLKVDKRNKLLKKRVQFLRSKANFKDNILELFENDEYDLGDGVKISKEVFFKIYERYEKNCYNFKDTLDKNKTGEFLRTLFKMYNPEYETVFDIEYLDTEEKKLQEFNRRKDKAEYQSAPYQCARCCRGFRLKCLLVSHMKKHDESYGPHECHICAVRFFSATLRRSHMVNCHSAVYVCRLCRVTFYYFSSMLDHFNQHKGKEFQCTICDGVYRTVTGLANHKRTHLTSHICTTCARSFVSAKGLMNHRAFKHKDIAEAAAPSDTVRCAECDLTLDSQKVFERHLRISHRKIRYTCRCKRSFSSIQDLRRHNVEERHQHSYKKPENVISSVTRENSSGKSKACHLCEECGKQFVAYTVFQDHMNTHTGARPYLCPECPRAFASAAICRSHTARHRPPKHQCKLCRKFFSGPCNLSLHMRIHKNDRRYKCEVCSASFLANGALQEHIRGVHQNQRRVRKINKLKVK